MSAVGERNAFLWSLSALVILAWLILWLWGRSPYGRYLSHAQLGEISLEAGIVPFALRIAVYLIAWTLMTVAMMLPTTLPLVQIFHRLTFQRADRSHLAILMITGYLGVWVCFGIAAHMADWVVHEVVERSTWLEANGWAIGAATLLLAGGFQFSRLKYRCLDKCRAPLSFVMQYWRGRHDRRNALLLGMHHGLFCLGCCWALMLLMFGVGLGNVGWLVALAAVMATEKNIPWGRKLSAPVGLFLLACSALVVLNHTWPGRG